MRARWLVSKANKIVQNKMVMSDKSLKVSFVLIASYSKYRRVAFKFSFDNSSKVSDVILIGKRCQPVWHPHTLASKLSYV